MAKSVKKKMKYEDAIILLEEIISKIEDEDTSMEDGVNLYKEAMELSIFCGEYLKNIEQEISVLQESGKNVFTETEFKQEKEF